MLLLLRIANVNIGLDLCEQICCRFQSSIVRTHKQTIACVRDAHKTHTASELFRLAVGWRNCAARAHSQRKTNF